MGLDWCTALSLCVSHFVLPQFVHVTCCQVSLTTCIKGKQQEKRCLATDHVRPFMFTTQKEDFGKIWCSFCYPVISGELRSQGFCIFLLNEERKNTRILDQSSPSIPYNLGEKNLEFECETGEYQGFPASLMGQVSPKKSLFSRGKFTHLT